MISVRLFTNIESYADLVASSVSYHPTPQSLEFVNHVASSALHGGGAHALMGPYGAGKSSLAAFALNQLSYQTEDFSPTALHYLFRNEECSVAQIHAKGGLTPIPIMGSSEPLAFRLVSALNKILKEERGKHHTGSIDSCLSGFSDTPTPTQTISLLEEFSYGVCRAGKAGVLLVIDEFGRHLDHMLATSNDDDFHLLQSIAELTGNIDAPLSLVIVQHYGLEHYSAKFVGERRAEWEKVRGRFRETMLNNTETDTAQIISKVFARIGQFEMVNHCMPRHRKNEPRLLREPEFKSAAKNCQPLHPMTIIMLSRLARLLGQQERTVVGWLTSDMKSGFNSARDIAGDGWIYPEALFDHFFSDALIIPTNPSFAKRFAAIHSAYARIGDEVSAEACVLFRILAMLSFCGGRGLAADKASALSCLPPKFPFDKRIKELTKRSLVIYRRYKGEYVIWEGSDYDVVGRVDEKASAMSLDLAAEMNQRVSPQVLAHRHFIQTGNRRCAQLQWLRTGEPAPHGNGAPRILVWIGSLPSAILSGRDIVGVAMIGALEPHLKEAAAIRLLLDDDMALQDDAIARDEMKIRLGFNEVRISALSEELLNSDLQWRFGNKPVASMQQAVTNAMDETYPNAFLLHNELVNRDRVSGQVSSALRKLIQALHDHIEKENLGIEKFPAERIIYESLLKQNGMHVMRKDGSWRLRLEGKGLPCGLQTTLASIRQHILIGGKGGPATLESVVSAMSAPPFGMKRTPTLLMCVLILLANKNEHELYEDHAFLPQWGPQTLLRMLKAPGRFAISAAAKYSVGKRFMRDYREALTGLDSSDGGHAPVAIVRELLVRHSRLSAYARQTTTISETTQAFRRAIRIAKSPGDMLFQTIPRALGYKTLPSRGTSAPRYLEQIRGVQSELDSADGELLRKLVFALVDTLGCESIADARRISTDLARQILANSNMHHSYGQFLKEVVRESITDDSKWFEGVIGNGLGVNVQITSWSDAHSAQAEFLLRKSLLGIQHAGQLLSKLQVQENTVPFAVFWSNAEDHVRPPVMAKLTSMIKMIPAEDRLSVIINLAQEFKGTS